MMYAGFWRRYGAYLIDVILIQVAGFVMGGVSGLYNMNQINNLQVIIVIVYTIGAFLYFPLLESSQQQATYGKMMLGLKVIDKNGNRLSFWKALGRHVLKFISINTIIGAIICVWSEKKQGLHDMIIGTYVIYDPVTKPMKNIESD